MRTSPRSIASRPALFAGATMVLAVIFGVAVSPPEAGATGSSTLVISQVYGAGGNSGATYNRDFIEIYNRGTTPVSLTGYSVQYASTLGSSWQATSLPSFTLQPGQYFLIGESTGINGVPLPAVDASGTIAMAAGAGKVILASTTTLQSGPCPSGASIVDVVGYGVGTNCYEGSGPTATLGTTTSAQRAGGGCTDTDNNAGDFAVLAVAPRNTATSGFACEPGVQASSVAFSAVTSSGMTVAWTPGSGSNRLVVAKAGGPLSGTPVDGTSYSASAAFGSGGTIGAGEYVVYNGTGASVAVTGLSPSTTYYFAVFEFSGSGGRENYRAASPATGSQATAAPPLVLSETHVDVACKGGSTGSIDLTVAGGTAPYSYAWSNSATTEDLSGLGAGSYSVTVTDAASQSANLGPITVTEPAAALAVGETHTTTCLGTPDGSIDLTVTGGTAPYSYLWSNSATTEDLFGLAAGSYSVTVTDAHGCTATLSADVVLRSYTIAASADANGSIDPSGAVPVDCGADKAFAIAANPGYHIADVLVDGGSVGPLASYTFHGVTAEGHSIVASFAVDAPLPARVDVGAPAGPITQCTTTRTLPVTLSRTETTPIRGYSVVIQLSPELVASGGASAFTDAELLPNPSFHVIDRGGGAYQVDDVTLGSSPCGSSATSGTLFTIVVAGNVPSGTGTVAITSLTLRDCDNVALASAIGSAGSVPIVAPMVLTETHTDVSCYGGADGAIDLTVTGGTAPYGFAWTGGASGEDPSALAAGSYTVTVTDANGCTAELTAAIGQPAAALSVTETHTDALCFGGATGAIDLTVTGGTTPYGFSWTGGASGEDPSGLAAGSYTVTVTDAHGCTAELGPIAIGQPAQLELSATHLDAACGLANGSIDLTVSGGTAPYGFSWTGGASGEDPSGLAAGSYSVTVTDAHGCTTELTEVVGEVATMVLSETHTDVSCYGGSDGAIDLSVTGGTEPYTYAWTGGATGQDPTGLAAGSYSVTVTDARGCTAELTIDIGQPAAALSVTETHSDVSCFGGANGAIDLTVTGGTAPYGFAWTGGASGEDPSGLAAGSYTVTVTDAHGCTAELTIAIGQPAAALSVTETHSDVSCYGGTNGAIDLTVTGGTAPYGFAWTGGASGEDPSGLAAGSYTVTVTDSHGCTAERTIAIGQPAQLELSATHVDAACNGGATGSIDLTVTGGTEPYAYAWTGGATVEDPTGLAAGSYTVTVTDAHGCTATLTEVVGEASPIVVTETHSDVSCFGGANGAIDLTVTGGTPPYGFAWTGGASGEDPTGLAAGSYTVTVTDAHGCMAERTIDIGQPAAALSVTETHTDVACFGGSTGAIDLTVSGGTSPYGFAWSNSAATEDLAGITAGSYSVTVTDAHGCTATLGPIAIGQPAAALALTESHINVACFGGSTGAINLTPTGGTFPYAFLWSNSATSEDLAGITAGSYSVTVTDAHGCTATLSPIVVTQPAAALTLTESHVDVSCFGGSNGAIDLTVAGGTSPYAFLWSNSATTEDLSGLTAGDYSVTVTDAKGCTATLGPIAVGQPAAALALAETHTATCLTGPDGTIDLTVTGGTGPYAYLWSNSATTEDLAALAVGSYSVTVTDAKGCTASLGPIAIVVRTYTIAASADANGSITPSGSVSVECGADQAFAIAANAGYHIADVLVDGSSVGAVSAHTFVAVTADHTIAASFGANPVVPPITALAAAQVKSGNGPGSTTRIAVTWPSVPPTSTVEVWRAGFGNYPEYDDAPGAGSAPTVPTSYPPDPGRWTVVTGLTTSGQTDLVPARDFYFYVAYVTDLYGTRSAASNLTGGTLNYYLGDVSNGYVAGTGNDTVFTEDISLLGAHYGLTGPAVLPYHYLDVGPTTNYSVDALPTTDNVIDFEDLILFAINYNAVSAPQAPLADRPAAPGVTRDEVVLDAPGHVAEGGVVEARVSMTGTGLVQGLSIKLSWDAAVVQPVDYAPGDWAAGLGATVLSARPGSVDAVLLGAGHGFQGSGLVATLGFRALAAGDPKLHVAAVDGRDAANQKLTLATSEQTVGAVAPAVTRLAPAMPNPFCQTATLAFSLSQAGPVQLVLYSVDGRKVRTLLNEFREAGEYRMTWDGRDDGGAAMGAGVYYAHLVTVKGHFTRTLTYLR